MTASSLETVASKFIKYTEGNNYIKKRNVKYMLDNYGVIFVLSKLLFVSKNLFHGKL